MNMIETRTIRIQLRPTPEQAALLLQTMQEYTTCFNEVSQLADAENISSPLSSQRARPLELISGSIDWPSLPSLVSLGASTSRKAITAPFASDVHCKAKVQNLPGDISKSCLGD